jgi:signal transduction histidine kinase
VIEVTAKLNEQSIDFIVSDDGPGIPLQHQEKVFGIFQTLKPRDEVEGSGMGLAVVKKLLQNYHSSITIESDGKHGTKMHFNWPSTKNLRTIIDEE